MTLNSLYRNYLLQLQSIYQAGEAAEITSIIFQYYTGFSRSDVIKEPSALIDESTKKKLEECLGELLLHRPVQYITGEAWFYKMKLKVSPAVLIPRPETEELVMQALHFIQTKKCSVLDIGTGSGCIAIAINKNAPLTMVTAIDISNDALEIARENAITQKTFIQFVLLNFLDKHTWTKLQKYDVIISNPPYIPETEIGQLDKNVTEYEPHKALFVPANAPCTFYEKIAEFGIEQLNAGGKIFMETHEKFANEVAVYFREQGYEAVIKKDMFEKERMVIASKR